MAVNRRVRVSLFLSAEKMQAFYAGAVRNVAATTVDGRVVHFPVNILRPFVDRNGVNGSFDIEVDQDNKFVAIHRVS